MTKPGVAGPRQLQKVNRRENACPPVAYFSDSIRVQDPRLFHLRWEVIICGKKKIGKQTHTGHRQSIDRKQIRSLPASPQKKMEVEYSRVPRRGFLFAPTGVELLVFFARSHAPAF